MTERQPYLDALRGVASLIVVMSHYMGAFYPYTVFGKQEQASYQQHSAWEIIFVFPPFGLIVAAHFAVCLFFILSGYVLSYPHLGEKVRRKILLASMVKRPIRLGGLVIFTILLGAGLWYSKLCFNNDVCSITQSKPWFNNLWKGDIDLYRLLIDVTTSPFSSGSKYNVSLWTIKIELYGSLFVYLFLFFFGNFKYRLLCVFVVFIFCADNNYRCFAIGLFLADMIKNHGFVKYFERNKIFFIFIFILFVYFSSYPQFFTSESLSGTIYNILPDGKSFYGCYPMVSALFIFVLISINNRFKICLNAPCLQFIGRISYGVYAIHILVIGSISSWLFLSIIDYVGYDLSFLAVIITGIPTIIALSYLITEYIDNPSIKVASIVGEYASRWYLQ